jgi:hypothetical protein
MIMVMTNRGRKTMLRVNMAAKSAMAVGLAIALSSVALAKTARHKPSIRTHGLQRALPPVKSGSSHPNYGNPIGVSRGGFVWNGRSASELGGEMLFNQ